VAQAIGNGGSSGTISASASFPTAIGSVNNIAATASGPSGATVNNESIALFQQPAANISQANGQQAAAYVTVSPLVNDVTDSLAGDTNLLANGFGAPGASRALGVLSTTANSNGQSDIYTSTIDINLKSGNSVSLGLTNAVVTGNGFGSLQFTLKVNGVVNSQASQTFTSLTAAENFFHDNLFSSLGSPSTSTDLNLALAYTSQTPGTSFGATFIVSRPATTIIWTGATNNRWDTSTPNWSANPYSNNTKAVQFDDTGANTNINIVSSVSPIGATFDNNSAAYTVGGAAITGSAAIVLNGAGSVMLTGTNSYSGGTTVNNGHLQTTVGGALGTGPLSISSAPGVNASVSLGGNETLNGLIANVASTGSGALSIAGGSTLTIPPTGSTSIQGTLNVSGAGTLSINSAMISLASGSSLQAGGGTLKLNVASGGSTTVGVGVTATVSTGATLELAGTVSGLTDSTTSDPTRRVEIADGGTIHVDEGAVQQVGGIDGNGIVQVDAGANLLASRIVQAALVIGGTAGNPARVTIDASDAAGNPLGQSGGFALADSLTPSGPVGAEETSSAGVSSVGGGVDVAALSLDNSVGGNPSPVPEPSTAVLVLLAVLGVICTELRRHRLRCRKV
jgi:autotransporter-associated beta strand protein